MTTTINKLFIKLSHEKAKKKQGEIVKEILYLLYSLTYYRFAIIKMSEQEENKDNQIRVNLSKRTAAVIKRNLINS